MAVTLPLNKMTTAEKLSVMERIWDDLCRNQDEVPSPAWHRKVLERCERRIRSGKARFSDIEVVKARLRKSAR